MTPAELYQRNLNCVLEDGMDDKPDIEALRDRVIEAALEMSGAWASSSELGMVSEREFKAGQELRDATALLRDGIAPKCEPPEGTGFGTEHWLEIDLDGVETTIRLWDEYGWHDYAGGIQSPAEAAAMGFRYHSAAKPACQTESRLAALELQVAENTAAMSRMGAEYGGEGSDYARRLAKVERAVDDLTAPYAEPNYDFVGAYMSDPECFKQMDGDMQLRLMRAIAENQGIEIATPATPLVEPSGVARSAFITEHFPNAGGQRLHDLRAFLDAALTRFRTPTSSISDEEIDRIFFSCFEPMKCGGNKLNSRKFARAVIARATGK